MWSPRKCREARMGRTVIEQQAAQEKLDKAKRKQDQEDARIQKQLELEQRPDGRERLKKEREKEKAKKQAEQQRKKAEKRLPKRLKTPNRGRGKLLKYLIQRTSIRNNLGAVHQRMQPQKLPYHPQPESLHAVATSHFPANPDRTDLSHCLLITSFLIFTRLQRLIVVI
jgi:hypothetical protein